MTMLKDISLEDFLSEYEEGYVFEVVVVRNRIIGKSVKHLDDQTNRYEVVWAVLP